MRLVKSSSLPVPDDLFAVSVLGIRDLFCGYEDDRVGISHLQCFSLEYGTLFGLVPRNAL